LIEQHPIVLAASAAAFVAATERRGEAMPPHSALVISASEPGADSGALTFADAEARRVAKTYRSAVRLADDAAEFDELTRRAPAADVIHFAGHAIGDDRGIEPASIVLRRNGHERRVGVAEIGKVRLRPASVVVLAGCNTARGERRAAEGVISVAHGFLSAGAPSVIATLWPIDDEASSIFFPRLHEKLAEGLSPAEALRQAQLESIRRGDVPASLWASVQNIGS
jgi:CHAT domain-containing protein